MNINNNIFMHCKVIVIVIATFFLSTELQILAAATTDNSDNQAEPRIEMYAYGGSCAMTDGFRKQADAYREIYSEIEKKDGNVFGLSIVGNVHPHFGLEAAIERSSNQHNVYLTDATYNNEIVSENIGNAGLFIKANAIAYMLKGKISPYIKGGGGWYSECGEDFSPLFNYGGGIRFIVYKNIIIRAEYVISKVNYKFHIDQVEYGELEGGGVGLGEIPFDYSENFTFKTATIGIGFFW